MRKKLFALVCLLSLLIFASSSLFAQTPEKLLSSLTGENWVLFGKIYDKDTYEPIAGAKVTFNYEDGGQAATVSDAKGDYFLSLDSSKKGRLLVEADTYDQGGYAPYKIKPRNIDRAHISLASKLYAYEGHVTDILTGDSLPDAEVIFVYEENDDTPAIDPVKAKTDAQGRFTLKCFIRRKGTIKINKPGYKEISDFCNNPGAPYQIYRPNYSLTPANEVWTLRGRVVDEYTWLPLVGADVKLVYDEGGETGSVKTDSMGKFELKPPVNKPGKLHVSAANYKDYKFTYQEKTNVKFIKDDLHRISPVAGRPTKKLSMEKHSLIEGTVLAENTHLPAKGVEVYYAYKDKSGQSDKTCTDEQGRFALKRLADKDGTIFYEGEQWIKDADYNIYAVKPGHYSIKTKMIKGVNDSFILYGKVRDEITREPVTGVKASFIVNKETEVFAYTDVQGNYKMNVPVSKRGTLMFTKEGYKDFDARRVTNGNGRCPVETSALIAPACRYITGKVVYSKTFEPVVGAKLTFKYKKADTIYEAVTNSDGNYKIKVDTLAKGLPQGRIELTGEGIEERGNNIVVTTSDVITNFAVDKSTDTYTILGRVSRETDKTPVAGAVVEYVHEDGSKITTKTNANGDYLIEPLLKQAGVLSVQANGFDKATDNVRSVSYASRCDLRDFILRNSI